MANAEHIKMITRTSNELDKWWREDTVNNVLDLSNADFSNQTIKDAWLVRANLENAKFSNATLENVHFDNSILKNVNFDGATLNKVSLTSLKDPTGISIKNTNLENLDFSDQDLENTNFSNITLKNIIFDNSSFEGVNFYETNINNVSFKGSKNLHKAKNLKNTFLSSSAKYFEFCERNIINRFIDWENLRLLGKLPIFGASYFALIAIPMFFYILSKYNEHIEIFRAWAVKTSTSSPEYIVNFANVLSSGLHPAPVPQQSLLLLISTVFLAVGATLYTLFCPSRIKEFSRDQWVDQLGHSLFHYWPLAWRFPVVRVICVISYALGGTGLIWVLGNKVIDVIIFIIKYA